MRSVVSLFLLLPLVADATRDESNWSKMKSYDRAVRRHPVNPNAISQVDSDDETRAVAYYYMIVNGTTIDREVRYFLSPYQVSAVGDLNVFFLPGPLANWARNIGNFDVDPAEILEKYMPVALNDLPPMPRVIRRKIRELTYGYDLLRSSGVSREKYGREKASHGSHRVQSVDNAVATTTTTYMPPTRPSRPTRMITAAQQQQTAKPKFQPSFSRRKPNIFDREEQTIFESIVNDLVDRNEESTTPKPRPTNKVIGRIELKPAVSLVPGLVTGPVAGQKPATFVPHPPLQKKKPLLHLDENLPPVDLVPSKPKFKPNSPTAPPAPPTVDAALREFQFRPHSTPSTRTVDEYDEEEEDGKMDDIAHALSAEKHAVMKTRRPSPDSSASSDLTRVSHPRTHSIERNRIKEIIVGVEGFSPPTSKPVQKKKKRLEQDTLSSAEIIEKLSTIRSLQEELERQLEIKGIKGRKRVEAAHPEPELLDLEDLSAPDTFSRSTTEATTTTEEPTTTTEEPTTTTEKPTTTTTTTTHAPTTRRTPTTRRPRPTTTHPTTTHDLDPPPPPPPPRDDEHGISAPAPPPDTDFHSFHEDLVSVLGELDDDPQFLPPVPSEVFSGHSDGFFGRMREEQRKNEKKVTIPTTTTSRPTTARPTTRRTMPPTTTTTTTEPTTTEPITEATTETTTQKPLVTVRTLPTQRFIFVTQPPNTRPTRTTTTPVPETTTPVPTVPEFTVPEEIDLRTLRALTSLSNEEIDRIRRRFAEVDARAEAAQLAPGQELDEAMFRGLQMMEDFEAKARGATIMDAEQRLEIEDLAPMSAPAPEQRDPVQDHLAPMSSRFVPLGVGRRLATAAAVKTKNMDVEYDYEEDTVEESDQNPGRVLIFDEDENGGGGGGDHVRDPRRIRLQQLNEPLRRFEKVNNGRRDKFVFVRPDQFYDKEGVELKKPKGVDEEHLAEAIRLGSGRPVQLVSNDRQPSHRPFESHSVLPTPVRQPSTPAPLIGVPIHIAAVTPKRRLTPPPISSTAAPPPTRAQPRPPAHTPPVHLLPEQLQLLQLATAAARPLQQIPITLTPPPRPVQQLQPVVVQQLQQRTLPVAVQQPSQQQLQQTIPSVQPVPVQLRVVQPAQQLPPVLPATALQQVVTPPPQVAQIVFNQQPVTASLQSLQLQQQQQAAAAVVAAATTTISPTTTAATTPAAATTVQQSTTTATPPPPTTSTTATTTPAVATTAAATAATAAAPTPSPFLPNPAFRNPIHPSIPFTPGLNGLSVNQFLQQFFAQQQAIRAAARQLHQLQRTPKSVQPESSAAVVAQVPTLLQYPGGFAAPQYFWPAAPPPQYPAWFWPAARGAKTATAGKHPDVLTVSGESDNSKKRIIDVEQQ